MRNKQIECIWGGKHFTEVLFFVWTVFRRVFLLDLPESKEMVGNDHVLLENRQNLVAMPIAKCYIIKARLNSSVGRASGC